MRRKKVTRTAKVFVEEKENGRRGRVLYYSRDNAAAAATTLTIRHSRFAALTLAKLVASLALHPPVSATEADYAPHPSRCSLGTFSRMGEGFYCRAVLSHLTCLAHDRNPSRLIPAPNHAPVAR